MSSITIDAPAKAKKVFADIRKEIANGNTVNISYEVIPTVYFTPQKEKQLVEVMHEIEKREGVSPSFTRVEDLFTHLEAESDD